MERFASTDSRTLGEVYLTWPPDIDHWPTLSDDPDWSRLTTGNTVVPFGLLTVSDDPAGQDGWSEFADWCVQWPLVLVCSWVPTRRCSMMPSNMGAVMRGIEGLPTASPMTTWHDDEPIAETLVDFFNFRGMKPDSSMIEAFARIVLVLGPTDRREEPRGELQVHLDRANRTHR